MIAHTFRLTAARFFKLPLPYGASSEADWRMLGALRACPGGGVPAWEAGVAVMAFSKLSVWK